MSKSTVDWEAVEKDFRAGLLSLREMAAFHLVSHVAISKRAKAHEWTRDLSAKIKARAEALVNEAAVNAEVTNQRRVNDREIVEANALRIAQVRSEHRQDITRMRALVLMLLEECEAATWEKELFADLGELLRNADERGHDKLNEIYRKAMDLPQRIKGVKELAETLKTLVGMEREAYGLSVAGDGPAVRQKPVELSDDDLAAIASARGI